VNANILEVMVVASDRERFGLLASLGSLGGDAREA
jgi:hypothetical protein